LITRIKFQASSADKKKGLDSFGVKRTEHIRATEFGYRRLDPKRIRRDGEDLRIAGVTEVYFDPMHVVESVSEGTEKSARNSRLQSDAAERCSRSLAEDADVADTCVEVPLVLREAKRGKYKNRCSQPYGLQNPH